MLIFSIICLNACWRLVFTQIKTVQISIRDLVRNFIDKGDNGVFTYNPDNKPDPLLVCRPQYQRAFVYTEAESQDLIESIMNGYPIGLFYWAVTKNDPDHEYELMDGQQRTISICQYYENSFSVNDMFFQNLTNDQKDKFLNYKIDINIYGGTDSEKLTWFRIINKSGEPLSNQELRNAVYAGQWLTDAKLYFSKPGGPAVQFGDGYMKFAKVDRQELLEKALKWACLRDGYKEVESYMAKHQMDKDAQDLWQYYQDVINWAKKIFPKTTKKLLTAQDWGQLYHEYGQKTYNPNDLQAEIDKLIADDDVTKKNGIIPYVLSDETIVDQKYLHIRAFTHSQMLKKYQEQGGICPICKKHYEFSEMAGDHIVPWSQGGATIYSNLQMLCKHDNEIKSNQLLGH